MSSRRSFGGHLGETFTNMAQILLTPLTKEELVSLEWVRRAPHAWSSPRPHREPAGCRLRPRERLGAGPDRYWCGALIENERRRSDVALRDLEGLPRDHRNLMPGEALLCSERPRNGLGLGMAVDDVRRCRSPASGPCATRSSRAPRAMQSPARQRQPQRRPRGWQSRWSGIPSPAARPTADPAAVSRRRACHRPGGVSCLVGGACRRTVGPWAIDPQLIAGRDDPGEQTLTTPPSLWVLLPFRVVA